jgi:hypothetical protein
MVDSNSTSSIPTTVVSPNYVGDKARADADVAEAGRAASKDAFSEYLNKSGISVLQQAQQSTVFDAAEDIKSKSIYKDNGDSTLVS